MKYSKIALLFVSILLLSSCSSNSGNVTPETDKPQIVDPVVSGEGEIEPTPEPDDKEHSEHLYYHYPAVEPTCMRGGSKEYWECNICKEYTFDEPDSDNIVEMEAVYHYLDEEDERSIAPINHTLHYVDEIASTDYEEGLKGHYECELCDNYFDSEYNLVSLSELTIPCQKDNEMTLMDDIYSKHKSTKSGWSAVANGFSTFTHTYGTDSITTNNKAGWQLTREKYTDISMKIKIDGAGRLNPTSGYVTKGFFIGCDATNKSLRYKGITGAMPTGYMISFYYNTDDSTASWIHVFKWEEDNCDYQQGTYLGGYKGEIEGLYFSIQIRGKTLTFKDTDNNPILMIPHENSGHRTTSIYLNGYEGGHVGIYSWTTSGQTYSEPDSSTFYIEDFSGKVMENKDSGYTFIQNMLSPSNSVNSTNKDIAYLTNRWFNGEDKYTLNASGGFDKDKNLGSWRLTNKEYDNFSFKLKMTNPTDINPYSSKKPSCTSILFGASSSGDYFTGYSLTVFYKLDDLTGLSSKWIFVHYHQNSVYGEFIGAVNVNMNNDTFYFTVINKYLHLYRTDDTEIYGDTYWPERSQGLYLQNYKEGSLGLLKWDETKTKYSVYDIKNLDESSSINYDSQNSKKRVNVFVLTGQSNMEGNTKAINGSSMYLKNYCDASEDHDYDELMTGYSDIQIACHNNYLPSAGAYYFTNLNDPLGAKFVDTKVGMGVGAPTESKTYFGPEVGIAEELHKNKSTEETIYLIKYAAGATGFDNGTKCDWSSQSNYAGGGYLYASMIQYVRNCLKDIQDMGYIPVIRGLLWMQGEHNSSSINACKAYVNQLANYISDFRCEFASYAVDNNAININFIDAGIYTGEYTNCVCGVELNEAKIAVSNMSDSNYYIDTNCDKLRCITQNGGSGGYGGGDGWHYSADSMMKLGNAFADVILNNNMLNF